MLGEQSFQPYAINTFSHRGKNFEEITPIHYVRPHEVRPYTRKDGTLVSGYWRDGDGDTTIDRMTGYYSRNPSVMLAEQVDIKEFIGQASEINRLDDTVYNYTNLMITF